MVYLCLQALMGNFVESYVKVKQNRIELSSYVYAWGKVFIGEIL